jgi:hypothetical protein
VESSCELGNEPSRFHKMLGNNRVAAQLVASRVVLGSTELVTQIFPSVRNIYIHIHTIIAWLECYRRSSDC